MHPQAKINIAPRFLAAYAFLLVGFASSERDLTTPLWVSFIVFSLAWPFVAVMFSAIYRRKRTELFNMSIDAVLSTLVFVMAPNQFVLFAVALVVIGNATFVGSFSFGFFNAVVIAAVGSISYALMPFQWHEIPVVYVVTIKVFLISYFTFFANLVFQLMRKIIRLNRKIEVLYKTDPLTGCYNRLYLNETLPKALSSTLESNSPMSLVFADLDKFKNINDKYGHQAGDDLLKAFVKIATTQLRQDIDWIARFGGEEFVIVMPRATKDKALKLAEKIRIEFEAYSLYAKDAAVRTTCSFGVVSTSPAESVMPFTMLAHADKALYESKQTGRNKVTAYQNEVNKRDKKQAATILAG